MALEGHAMSTSFCKASLYVGRDAKKRRAEVSRILGRFKLDHKDVLKTANPDIELEGFSYQEIKDGLVIPLAAFLDPDKRSSVYYRSSEGTVSTIMIVGGQIQCS